MTPGEYEVDVGGRERMTPGGYEVDVGGKERMTPGGYQPGIWVHSADSQMF